MSESSKNKVKILGMSLTAAGAYMTLAGLCMVILPQLFLVGINPSGGNMFEGGRIDILGILAVFLISTLVPVGWILFVVGLVALVLGLSTTIYRKVKESKNV
jgi:hypothetical protein